jgi:hypothetical protein
LVSQLNTAFKGDGGSQTSLSPQTDTPNKSLIDFSNTTTTIPAKLTDQNTTTTISNTQRKKYKNTDGTKPITTNAQWYKIQFVPESGIPNILQDNINSAKPYEKLSEHDERYSAWMPPKNQTGDGRTTLNDKYGY